MRRLREPLNSASSRYTGSVGILKHQVNMPLLTEGPAAAPRLFEQPESF